MFLPLFAVDFNLNLMAGSVKIVKLVLADKLLSRQFTVGIVNCLESIERTLSTTFGCNLPVSDSEFMSSKFFVF